MTRTFLVLLATIAACVPEFADDRTTIFSGRVLAVRATPAEAKVGQQVELTALVASPITAPARTDDLEWALCTARKPLTELGPVAQECIDRFGSGSPNVVRIGRGPDATAAILPDACRKFGPLAAPTEAGGVAGRPVDPDLTGGYHQPVLVGSGLGVALASIRLGCGIVGLPTTESVRFNQGYRPNENPEIDRVALADGRLLAETTIRAGSRVDLRAAWAACPRAPVCGDGLCTAGENQSSCAADCRENVRGCTGAETYLWPDPETRTVATRREGMSVAWYATDGTFTANQTGRTETDPDGTDATNTWTAPTVSGQVRLWVVLRDDRGGIGWRDVLVRVEP